MFGGDDEFEGSIDINKILNDSSLHDELVSLGWVEHSAPSALQSSKQANRTQPSEVPKKQPQQVAPMLDPESIIPLDIGDMGLVDEDNVQLTEADMEDEGLLAEFEFISGSNGEDNENHASHSHEEDDIPAERPVVSNYAALTPAATHIQQATAAAHPLPPPPPAPTALAAQSQIPGIPTVEEAKRNAVKFKREGNNAEALKWLRYSKQLESGTFSEPPVLPAGALWVSPPSTTAAAAPVAVNGKTGAAATATAGPKAPSSAASPPPLPPRTNKPNTPLQQQHQPQQQHQQLHQPQQQLQRQHTTSSYGHSHFDNAAPGCDDPFGPLDSAIQEASTAALREAKYAEHTDKKQAVIKMREYKALQQELAVLRSRRNMPGAAPALFHWQTVRKETIVENTDIAEDEVKLIIEGAYDIAGIVESHSSRTISVSYQLGIAKDDGAAPAVVPAATYADGRVVYHHEVVLPILKRGRHVQQLYARKKATFDLVLHKGFWKGNEVLCQAVLPLSDLLTKATIGGPLPLKTVGESGNSKRGKVLGGQLTVYVSIRSPLSGPQVVVSEERKLVIEGWPPVVALVPPPPMAVAPAPVMTSRSATPSNVGLETSAHNSAVAITSETEAAAAAAEEESQKGLVAVAAADDEDTAAAFPSLAQLTAAAAPAPNAMMTTGPLATLTEKERADPHSVDFIESNDVLEAEIAAAEALAGAAQEEDEQFNAQLRAQLLQTKLQLLVFQVQSDQLSLEEYLERVRARLKRDQLIALHFKTLGDKESVATALAVMKRVQIMKKEIQNAEEA